MTIKKEKTFEENLARLEEIVSILEEGKISLEEGIDLFEEGIKLSKICNNELESIEKKITMLIEENGDIKEEKFDIDGAE